MNEDRNLKLSNIAVEKNNPGLYSNEEKSNVRTISFDRCFHNDKRSAETAVAACFALFLYSWVFTLTHGVVTKDKTFHMAEEITNNPPKNAFVNE